MCGRYAAATTAADWVEEFEVVFEGCEEQRRLPSNQVGDAVAGEQPAAVGRGVNTADQPFFVSDQGTGAGGKLGQTFFFLE